MKKHILVSSISEVARSLRDRSLTASELCELTLKRIADTGQLNAFITVTGNLAKEQAKLADERFANGKPLSMLDGIPIAVKDNFSTKQIKTSCASKMLDNYLPTYDATLVEKLRSAGSLMVGKTNLDEFAMGSGTYDSFYGPAINPWNFDLMKKGDIGQDWHIAGGSSGGSAVSVAMGGAFASLGTDTGGSTRHPAAMLGVCGFKPSYGLLSRKGMIPLNHSMDTAGILARHVEDVELVFRNLAGLDEGDATSIEGPPWTEDSFSFENISIGIPKEYDVEGMSPEIHALWKDVADKFANAGARITEVSLPHSKYSLAAYAILKASDVASNMACFNGIYFGHRSQINAKSMEELYMASRSEAFNDTVKTWITAGTFFTMKENYEGYYDQAAKVRRLIRDEFTKVFQDVDLLLTPVTLNDAPTYFEAISKNNKEIIEKEDICVQPANMAGVPAISVPCKLSARNLPLSLQLIAPYLKDQRVLAAAKKLEAMMNYPHLDLSQRLPKN
ncbi:Glutamyl-tRNA(Gln) amidotransferase subunit A, mitochondrial [Halotydeus destructor]|nr:Glutamyl-tRNA(Gln) amidotransferase subunit A, mitochondrial [Halotydeus destructor]